MNKDRGCPELEGLRYFGVDHPHGSFLPILHDRSRIARIPEESEKIHKQFAEQVTTPQDGSPGRCVTIMRTSSESTFRRRSLYLRVLEQLSAAGHTTIASAALARRGAA